VLLVDVSRKFTFSSNGLMISAVFGQLVSWAANLVAF